MCEVHKTDREIKANRIRYNLERLVPGKVFDVDNLSLEEARKFFSAYQNKYFIRQSNSGDNYALQFQLKSRRAQ